MCKVTSSVSPGGESKDGLGANKSRLQSCLYRKHPVNLSISIAVPVEICACGLVRMVLVNEVKRTGTVTELSVTGTCGRRGGKVWWQHRRGKPGKVERRVELMEGGTHSS